MDSIEKLIAEPHLIEQIGTAGKKRLANVYATDLQLGTRLSFLQEKIAGGDRLFTNASNNHHES
jgi:hypothetical protein